MSQPAVLSLLKDGELVSRFPIDGEVVLGRSPTSTIHVSDRAISREHAVFRIVGDQIQVEKRSEFGPLIVNGTECTSALLKQGDVVSAGAYVLRLDSPPVGEGVASQRGQVPPGPIDDFSMGGPQGGGDKTAVLPSGGGTLPGLKGPDPENSEDSPQEGHVESNENDSSAPKAVQAQDEGQSSQDPFASPVADQPYEQEDRTRLTPMGKLHVKLVFPVGTANVEELELTQDSITIGRSKECDVVLNDKKASRKNTLIRKSGVSFIIKDLQSANGTLVNGAKIQEQELSGDDVIKIGNVEFVFKAMSMEYMDQEKDLVLPPEPAPDMNALVGGFPAQGALPGLDPQAQPLGLGGPASAQPFNVPGMGAPVGALGAGVDAGKKKTLVERFRALPRRTQIIASIAGAALLWWVLQDDEVPVVKKKAAPAAQKKAGEKTPATGGSSPGLLAFEVLSPEQQQFVEAQHALAFDYYRNKEYDKALFEINKIFSLVADYKDAREIERYAKEGKRKMEALEEERRKKEEEEILKAKIAQLIEETRQRMEKKEFDQAKELFIQIMGIDPDNKEVNQWRRDIEAYEEQLKLKAQQKQVEDDINQHGRDLLAEAAALRKSGHIREAMEVAKKVKDIGVSDKTLIPAADQFVADCLRSIANRRNPVLKRAKKAEEAGEFSKAFALYKKATQIDPPHPAGYAGMNRIRKVLHDGAKAAYQEAVLAESFSDFANAKRLFQECLAIAPAEDEYHGRAQRKLIKYFKKKDPSDPTSGSGLTAEPAHEAGSEGEGE